MAAVKSHVSNRRITLYLLLSISLFTFDPFLGFGKGTGVLIGCIFGLLFLPNNFYTCLLTVPSRALWLFILLAYLVVGIVVSGGETSLVPTLFKVSMVMLVVPVMLKRLALYGFQSNLVSCVSIVWILQAIYCVSVFFMPDLYKVGSFMRPPPSSHIYLAADNEGLYVRTYPASGQMLSGLGAIAAVNFATLVVALKYSQTNKKLIGLGMVAVTIVGGLSGRTFLIGLVLALGYLTITNFKLALRLWACMSLMLVLIYFGTSNALPHIHQWAFEPIHNLLTGRGLITESTDSLFKNHYFSLPIYDVLIPSFHYKTESGWAAGSDSGYIRYLLFGGAPFLFMLVLSFYRSLLPGRGSKTLVLIFLFTITIKQESLTNGSLVFSLLVLNMVAGAWGPKKQY